MKVATYTPEQLKRMIARLESFKGTPLERNWDQRYLRAYRNQLQQHQENND